MRKNLLLSILIFAVSFFSDILAQETNDSTAIQEPQKAHAKTGISWGALPAIGYNTDLGFRYGLLGNIYNYGDGSDYPNYEQSLYLEWSRTTKGNGINRAIYDTRTLIPHTKMLADLQYITEQSLDFFGFNGYNSIYNENFINPNSQAYISRMFYNHERKNLGLSFDFQGMSKDRAINWLAGISFMNSQIGTVNIDKLNKGKTENLLPDTALLFDKYVAWGVIPKDEARGGNVIQIKGGVVYDTRNRETNPSTGIWTEASLMGGFGIGKTKAAYSRLLITHRHYLTLIDDHLTFSYRLSYQTTLLGKTPFYMLPYVYDSYSKTDGVGGSKTVRGILRNRIAGEGFVFGNAELRSQLVKFNLFQQHFYIGLNAFLDAGMITKQYQFDKSGITTDGLGYFDFEKKEIPHVGAGLGLRIAMNSNFVVAIDYGKAFNKQDGSTGMYIGLGYLY